MSEIGVRELKIHASEVVREVKEKRTHYIVTHRGHPVAAIVPVEDAQTDSSTETSAWDELERLGQQISLGWQQSKNSTEILSQMRR
jgi:prevent-host-death family protein